METSKKKYVLSLRLLPSIIIVLASLAYSFSYLDSHSAYRFHYLQAASYFGVGSLLLFLDFSLEHFYKDNKKLSYNLISVCLSLCQLVFFGIAILIYFKQLPETSDASKRIFPAVLLALLLLSNTLYRILIWQNKWHTEDKFGNDMIAAYIGYMGLGSALIVSFPYSAILVFANEVKFGYLGILSIVSLASGILEALIGTLWLSWGKMRETSKSNIFFYLTLFAFFASVAGIIASSFSYSDASINLSTGIWCWANYGASALLLGLGHLYLNYLQRC